MRTKRRFLIFKSVVDYNVAGGDTSDGRTDSRAGGRAVGRTGAGVLGCGDSMSDLSQLSIENRLRKQERPSARAGRGEEMMWNERTETNRRFKVGVKQGTPDKICSEGNFCSI